MLQRCFQRGQKKKKDGVKIGSVARNLELTALLRGTKFLVQNETLRVLNKDLVIQS